ncbi:hypothetical protein [Paraliobacillus ryukyuensis]|uniref:hypothetical protein n=1 Tax=Paraliobacillus ryukyuensis TaxID=200904 RepID=UPI0015C4723C|nr:hypothetical protein [Paraliobacillus ryukyuensis]
MTITRLITNLGVIAKHLEKNEKYLRYPERKIEPVIQETEQEIKKLEKEMSVFEQ